MKKKVVLTLIVVLIMAIASAVILSGCNNTLRKVTEIRVEDTEIFMAPRGEPSTYQINASVLPITAKNQAVYFRYEKDTDREFISIDANGFIKARAIKNKVTKNEYDEDVYTPIPIYVFVHSRDNPKVSIKISILVEEVAVKRIYFSQSTNKVFFEDESTLIRPQTIKPNIEPAHAIIGRELNYTIDDTSVLDITSSPDSTTATITPKKIGATLVTVNTRPIGAFDEPLRAHATFQVVYAALHYSIKLDSPIAALNQIQGVSSKIEFSLIQDSPKSDPNPEIAWYINDTPINQEGARNTVKLIYDVKNLPQGEYRVRVVLSNANEEKALQSDVIKIYQPLRQMRLGVLDMPSGLTYNFEKGDVLRVTATKSDAEFPPEAYKWVITKPDNSVEYLQTAIKAVSEIGGARVADLNYILKEEGAYKVTVKPIVKGVPIDVTVEELQISVAGENAGNDLRRILVEGKATDETKTEYLPYITWKTLPYQHDNMQVEVKKQEGADYSIQSFQLSEHPSMYDGKGIFIPQSIATLDEDFAVRLKGDRFGWTNWYNYSSKINEDEYSYFDPVWQNQNRYITNIEDLSILLNELVVFRPSPEDMPAGMAKWGNASDGPQYDGKLIYKFDFFSPYRLTEEEQTFYPPLDPEYDVLYPDDAHKQNFAAMMIVALRTYVETTDVSMSVEMATALGEYTVSFAFPALEESFKTKEAPATPKVKNDLFVKSGEAVSGALPIDLLPGRSVKTTDQLFLAAMSGYKPVPEPNSPADKAYKVARYIIRNSITTNMTQEEKILAIYDFISKNTSYDYELAEHGNPPDDPIFKYDGFHIEGVFKGQFDGQGEVIDIFLGKAVCDGISKSMSLLLSMLGITNTRQVGMDNNDVAHVWNLVMVYGRYYVVDATWALREITISGTKHEFISHKFLLTTDKEAYGIGFPSPKMTQYGKYEEKAEEPLYTGYLYPLHITEQNEIYNKYLDTEVELEYLVQEYLVPKIAGDTSLLLCDVALNLENPEEGNLVYDLYLASASADTMTYDEYIRDNRHQIDLATKINAILADMSTTVKIQTIAVVTTQRNNVVALKLYTE
jgi:hypothetical protein